HKDYGAAIPAEGREFLDHIISSAERMGQIIEDLLHLSQLGRQRLSKQPVDVSDLVQKVLDDLRSQQPGRQIQIKLGDLPDSVADPSLLKQVFVNLLSNAFKFTRPKPDPVIEVGSHQQNGERVFFVRDNGAGFDMRYAEN